MTIMEMMKDKLKARDLVAQHIDKLNESPRNKKMIKFRFGLLDGLTHTLQETADFFGGITRERVRQIEDRALRKINELKTKTT